MSVLLVSVDCRFVPRHWRIVHGHGQNNIGGQLTVELWEVKHRLRSVVAAGAIGQYRKNRPLVGLRGTGAAVILGLAATGATANPCRLALVLAIDVSSSVDESEDALQRGGLAAALIAPEVQAAFFASDLPVALAAFEWSGRFNQAPLLEWTLIESAADLTRAAGAIALSTRSHDDYPTAMGYALGYGATLLRTAPACDAQVIDVAGDGISNDGFSPDIAYAHFPFEGVIVNGLVVMDGQDDAALLAFYQAHVLRGPGAFIETATGFADYTAAMQRKLLRELNVPVIGALTDIGAAETPVQSANEVGADSAWLRDR